MSENSFPTPVPHRRRLGPRCVRAAAMACLASMLALAVVVAAPGLTGHLTVSAQAADDVVDRVSVSVTNLTPTAVTDSDTVAVTVVVKNGTSEPLDGARLTFSIVRYKISTPSILENWFSGAEALVAPTFLDEVEVTKPLEPGESRSYTLSAPASDLRLLPYADAAGPRGVIVSLTDTARGSEIASAKTFLLWYPSTQVEPVRVSILVPITGPAPTPADPQAWANALTPAVSADGRLDAILEATGAHRNVTWVVDPALVGSATSAGPAPARWAQNLLTAAIGREVFAVNPYDPDVGALAKAGVTPFLMQNRAPTPPAMTGWRRDLTLPATAGVDHVTLMAAVAQDRPYVVVRQGLEAVQPLVGEAPATAIVPTSSGPATALIPDQELSLLLSDPPPLDMGSTFEARQLLLTRLAIIAQANSADPAHVLLATPRDWEPGPDTGTLLGQIGNVPFINVLPLSGLLGTPVRDTPRSPLVPTDIGGNEVLSAATLTDARDEHVAVAKFSAIVSDPAVLTAKFEDLMAAATSTAWVADPAGQREALRAAHGAGSAILSGLSVVPGSTVNLISDRGDLPVTIRNDLDQSVTIGVDLVPNDRRLAVKEPATLTIPAQSAATANVSATAIGTGNVLVRVEVLASDGSVIAAPSSFEVRVRADWETVGTAAVGALLLVALTLGIIRTIRRGKKSTRMDPVAPEPPESPESPEDHA